MAEFWSQFYDLFSQSTHFRAGFMSALIVVFGGWVVFGLLNWLYARWLRVRQFFEPIQQPVKVPTEKGRSPAGNLIGCLGSLLGLLLFIALVIVALFWIAGSSGG